MGPTGSRWTRKREPSAWRSSGAATADRADQTKRLIFLSGGAFTAQIRDRLDQLGAPQLEKPVTATELRACVSRVVVAALLAESCGRAPAV